MHACLCEVCWHIGEEVSPAPRPPSLCNSDGKLQAAELKPTISTQADKDDRSPSQNTHLKLRFQPFSMLQF